MMHVFLPHDGEMWLCMADAARVTPLAKAPGGQAARRKFSTDGTEFGFLDQQGKRLGYYRLLDCFPWFECLIPPITLPKSCFADDFVIHDGLLIAGGHGRRKEALWTRKPMRGEAWTSIPLLEGVGKWGKSIDALFVRGGTLVAVDNIMRPKWILLYALEPEFSAINVEKVRLPTHASNESIRSSAEGNDVYALYSCGFNHGSFSYYISLLLKDTLNEIAVWSGSLEPSIDELVQEVKLDILLSDDLDFSDVDLDLGIEREIPLQKHIDTVLKRWAQSQSRSLGSIGPMLSSICDMAICGDHLVLALGTLGLRSVNIGRIQASRSENSKRRPNKTFMPVALSSIVNPTRLVRRLGSHTGIYAIGKNAMSELAFEWICLEQLENCCIR